MARMEDISKETEISREKFEIRVYYVFVLNMEINI